MVAVSVVVAARDPEAALHHLVRSIDAQTLPAAEFELVVAAVHASAARLRQLAERRPNVRLLTVGPEDAESARLARALADATGEYLLVADERQRLAPRALEMLLEAARRTGADVVLGRGVTAVASGCAVLPDDADRLDLSGVDPTGCPAMVRRSTTTREDAGAALLDLPALIGGAAIVSGVGRYACTTLDQEPTSSTGNVAPEQPTYRWSEGTLQVTVAVRLPEPAPPVPRAWLVVRQDLAEVALPATTEGDGPVLTVSAHLDPGTAEGGHPLGDGPWDLLLRLAWPGREVTLPLGAGAKRAAVVAGRPYVVRDVDHALQLDAGATRSSVIGRVPPARASVAESVHGSLVTLEYPDLHVHGDAVLDARLLLDRFGVPGRLVCEDGRTRLQAYVGSLAGTSTVTVVAGGGRPVQTGLRLQVDGTGGMAFEKAPSPMPSPSSTSGGVPLVQRLRRRLPGAIEPVVRRLARVPVLRRAYRRSISR